jgi:hypothetical protein
MGETGGRDLEPGGLHEPDAREFRVYPEVKQKHPTVDNAVLSSANDPTNT